MSKQSKRQNKPQGTPPSAVPLSAEIKTQRPPQDGTRLQKETLSASLKANKISIVGIAVSFLSLLAVYATLYQTGHAMKIDQRAWLGFKSVDLAAVEGQFGVKTQLENTGKTPALNVKTHQLIEERPPKGVLPDGPELDLKPDRNFSDFKGSDIVGPISPNAILNMEYGELGTGLIPLVPTAPVIAYYHGIINYDDVFGKHHWRTFCFYIQRRPTVDVDSNWQPCDKGNNIDTENE